MATATYNQTLQSAGAAAGDVGSQPSHCAIWDSVGMTNLVVRFNLNSTLAALVQGQPIQFAANELILTLTQAASSNDNISDFGLVEALRGMFSANRYVSWHTGDPGSSGSSNRITGITPTLLTVTNLTFAQ